MAYSVHYARLVLLRWNCLFKRQVESMPAMSERLKGLLIGSVKIKIAVKKKHVNTGEGSETVV